MGDASLYYHRVPFPWVGYKSNWQDVPKYLEMIDDMRTWCYTMYGDRWGLDSMGFWFDTEADEQWFRMRFDQWL